MRKGISYIEVMIMITIIAIIAAIAVPSFLRSREINTPTPKPKTDQQLLQEAYIKTLRAERPPIEVKPAEVIAPKDRFQFIPFGQSPDNRNIYVIHDNVNGKEFLMVGDGMVELKKK